MDIDTIKKRIGYIKKEQIRLEKLIEKQEDNGVFDNSLYDKIAELDKEKEELEAKLFLADE